jgi:hypothetical protein
MSVGKNFSSEEITTDKIPHKQSVSDASKDETISSEDKSITKTEETSTLNLQPSLMEVHHHGHVHEQKKWKEYIFQFLMLFFAVLNL